MIESVSNKLGFCKTVKLIILFIFAPKLFIREEEIDKVVEFIYTL